MKIWLKHHRLEILILSFAFTARLVFSLIIHPIQNYIFSDMNSYLGISQRLLASDRSLSNVFYPIGYPLFLTLISKILPNLFFPAIAILQSLMGLASLILLYAISKNILSRKFRLIYLIILACYYPWIDFGGYLMSETLATLLLILMVYLAFFFFGYKNLLWLFFLPVVIGLSSLVRANLLLSGIFIVFWLTIRAITARGVIVFSCGFILAFLLSSQIYRYYGGISSPMALNGGLVFMDGQCLLRGATDSNGWSFGAPVFTQRNLQVEESFDQPFTNSGYFYRQGINCLIANPIRIIEKPTELYYLFFGNVAWPSSDQPGFDTAMKVSHSLFNVTILPGLFIATYLFFKERKRLFKTRLAIIFITVISLVATTIVYYADIRYRLPFDGFLILLSLWAYQSLALKKLN